MRALLVCAAPVAGSSGLLRRLATDHDMVIGVDGGPIDDEMASELEFSVDYDPATIVESNTYTLSVRITDAAGNLLFLNDTSIPVLTGGAPTDEVEVQVVQYAAYSPMASDEPVVEERPEA